MLTSIVSSSLKVEAALYTFPEYLDDSTLSGLDINNLPPDIKRDDNGNYYKEHDVLVPNNFKPYGNDTEANALTFWQLLTIPEYLEQVKRSKPAIYRQFVTSKEGKIFNEKNLARKPAKKQSLRMLNYEIAPEYFCPYGDDFDKNNKLYTKLTKDPNLRKKYRESQIGSFENEAYKSFLLTPNGKRYGLRVDQENLQYRTILQHGLTDTINDNIDSVTKALQVEDKSLKPLQRAYRYNYDMCIWHVTDYAKVYGDTQQYAARVRVGPDGKKHTVFVLRNGELTERPCPICKEKDGKHFPLIDLIQNNESIFYKSHPGCNCYLELYDSKDPNKQHVYVNALGIAKSPDALKNIVEDTQNNNEGNSNV